MKPHFITSPDSSSHLGWVGHLCAWWVRRVFPIMLLLWIMHPLISGKDFLEGLEWMVNHAWILLIGIAPIILGLLFILVSMVFVIVVGCMCLLVYLVVRPIELLWSQRQRVQPK